MWRSNQLVFIKQELRRGTDSFIYLSAIQGLSLSWAARKKYLRQYNPRVVMTHSNRKYNTT